MAVAGFLAVAAFAASSVSAQSETMVATWYGPGFEGALTASGEPFDPSGYTAAHKTLPFGTRMIVTYNGASVVVVVNDRGPFIAGRDLDLSQGAADAIGLTAAGEGVVGIEYVDESVPVGPYSGTVAPVESAPVEEPVSEEPMVSQSMNGGSQGAGNQSSVVADEQYASGDQYSDEPANEPVAADGQYADDDAAVENQYSEQTPVAVESQYNEQTPEVVSVDQYTETTSTLDDVAPTTAVPAAGGLETPPAELVVPGSTVEKRVELAIAAPPADYAGPLPTEEYVVEEPVVEAPAVEEPSVEPSVESSGEIGVVYGPSAAPSVESGLTSLPDTGGLPVVPLVGGAVALLAAASIFGVRAVKGR